MLHWGHFSAYNNKQQKLYEIKVCERYIRLEKIHPAKKFFGITYKSESSTIIKEIYWNTFKISFDDHFEAIRDFAKNDYIISERVKKINLFF